MNGPSESSQKQPVQIAQAFGSGTRYNRHPATMTTSIVHGIDVTFSAKPSGSPAIQFAPIPDSHGCSGLGTKNAARSSPRALLLHSTGAARLSKPGDACATVV